MHNDKQGNKSLVLSLGFCSGHFTEKRSLCTTFKIYLESKHFPPPPMLPSPATVVQAIVPSCLSPVSSSGATWFFRVFIYLFI